MLLMARHFLIISILVFSSPLVSQTHYKFFELNDNQGLTNLTIHSITEDNIGFHWIGTDDGLFRFNGSYFEAYYEIGAENTIPGSSVNKIKVDNKNRVWILTNNGVGIYNYETDRIDHILDKNSKLLPENRVFLAISETEDGTILLGNSSGGIYALTESQGPDDVSELKISKLLQIDYGISDFELSGQELWIGTRDNGIIKLNIHSLSISQYEKTTDNKGLSIYDVYKTPEDKILIGTSQGLKVINSDGLRFNIGNSEIEIEDEVLSLLSDSNGHLWLGTRNTGLYKYVQGKDGYYIEDKHFSAGVSSKTISYRTISHIFQDKQDVIWLGTHGKGLNIFNPSGERVIMVTPSMADLVAHDNITSVWGIEQTDKSGLWFTTDGAGLYYYDFELNLAKKIASTDGPIVIDDDAILSLAIKNNNEIWLGTYSKGINIIDLESKGVTRMSTQNLAHELKSDDIRAIHQDNSGITWIGSNRGGLHYFDEETNKIISIENTEDLDIRDIIDDPVDPSILWLATYGEGLISFNKNNHTVINYNWNTQNNADIPIALCLTYSHNRLWVGTKNSGLQCFNLQSESFKSYENYGNLLSASTVKAILSSGKYLWISTNRGLSVFNVESETLSTYSTMEGVKLSQFNDGSSFLTANGDIAFGSLHGLSILNPETILSNPVLPKVIFTNLTLNNKPIKPGKKNSPLKSSLSNSKELKFNQDMDNFSIRFSVLNFVPSPSYEYSYFLENHDNEWINTKNTYASYRDISPGNYVFHARLFDPSTRSTGPVNSIRITVFPPWWQTKWAFALFSTFTILLVVFIYRLNKDRIIQKEKLYYEQKLKDREVLSMKEKIRFYTNFSHELRTPITLVLGPINQLLNNNTFSNSNRTSLKLAQRNANTLLKLVNRFLDFRKIDTESSQLNLGQYDLTSLCFEEAESFKYLANERKIRFRFDCKSKLYCWVDIEKIQIILNNLLSNALKFSREGDEVNFKAYRKNEYVVFVIEDNGVGIEKEEIEAIFQPFYQANNSNVFGGSGLGLSISKSLVEMHGGHISVRSRVGEGSSFKVKLPTGKEHFVNQTNINYLQNYKGELEHEIVDSAERQEEEWLSNNDNVILIVDDNEDLRHYIGSLFSKRFHLLFADNGVKALDIARKIGPNLVISDLMMPEMNGHELCRELKTNITTSHIPVVMLTAKSTKDDQIISFDFGADAYITKPFDSEILISRVENLLKSRKALKRKFEGQAWTVTEKTQSNEIEFLNHLEEKVLELLPNGNLNVPELCKEIGFSRTSLYRKIKSLTNLSINQFIRCVKLKRSAEMLVQEDMNVSEVAFALDFTDLKYFRNAFKKQYGMMPSEYKKSYRAKVSIDHNQLKKDMNF